MCVYVYLFVCPLLEMILEYALMDFCDTWIHWSSGGDNMSVQELGSKDIWGHFG